MIKNSYLFFLSTIALMVSNSPAQIPDGYYGDVDTSNGSVLRDTLHQVIDGHTRISFDNSPATFEILENADENPNNPGQIIDIYGNNAYTEVDGGSGNYNREHIWPRSYGFPDNSDSGAYPISDLHALFLSDNTYNQSRGNEYYDECTAGCSEFPTVLTNGSGGGSGVFPGNSNWSDSDSWQVWSGRQGDAARALLYMDVRYEPLTVDEVNAGVEEPDLILTNDPMLIQSVMTNQSTGYMGLLNVVLDWNNNDAVDDQERQHNEVVFDAQDNRNPFVDFPEFADCIFSGDCSMVAPIRPQNLTAQFANDNVTIEWDARIESDLAGYNVYRSTNSGGPYTQLNPSTLTGTMFVDSTTDGMSTYYYVVTSLDTNGNESIDSIEIEQDLSGTDNIIAVESFEDETGFTISGIRDTLNNGSDYFDLYTDATAPDDLDTQTNGIDGSTFLAAEDTNGSSLSNIYTVTFDPLDVSSFTNLGVTIGLNGNDSDNYDTAALSNGDFVRILYSIDGASDVLIGQFTKVGASGSNGPLGEDTNLDGLGDVEISDYTQLEDYAYTGIPDGSSLVIKLEIRMDSGNEEVVIDNIRITGESTVVSTVDQWHLY